MALLAGAALLGAAAAADAGPSTTPIVLDAAALDSITAGNFQVGVALFGEAGAQGGDRADASVRFDVKGSADQTGGVALGLIRASGFGLSSDEIPADSVAQTGGDAEGNVVSFVRTYNFNNFSSRYAVSESVTVAFGVSIAPIVLPATPQIPVF